MCLLLVKPAGYSIPFQYLKNAQEQNPHGSGIAFADGKNVKIEKDANWNAEDIAERLEYLEDNPVIVHFRYATHGSNTNDNTHPFKLPKRWAAAHNGIITDVKCKSDESDTRAFLRQNIVPALNHGASLTDKGMLGLIGETIGLNNKLAFLHGSGEYGIANEDCGHWRDGVWYSNHTYEDYEPYYPRFKDSLSYFRVNELECCYCGREIKKEFWVDSSGKRAEMLCQDCLEEYNF